PLMPYEQVRDFFYSHTYLHELDMAAEQMSEELGHHRGEIRPALAQRLRDKHGVHVLERDQQALGALHRYDQANRVLAVAAHLRPNQQAFRLAAQLALIEFEPL